MNPMLGLVPVLLATAAATGQVTTDFAGNNDTAYGVAVQADGRIVAVGNSRGAFALARYTETGALDTSFGGTGQVTTAIPGDGALARRVAVLADGRILVAGERITHEPLGPLMGDLVLARYLPDGTLDPSFGTGGVTITDIAGADDALTDMAIQPDGRIVVAGDSQQRRSSTLAEFLVARYTADGVLDTSFGTGGIVTTDFFGRWDGAGGVAIQADGRIVAAGQADQLVGSSGFTRLALARYTSTGALDPTFGTGGKVTTAFGNGWDSAADLAIQDDGRILAAGTTQTPGRQPDFALVRYTSAGALDPTFGTGGKVSTDRANSQEQAHAILIHPAGRIVAAGYSASDFALVGYRADGSLDQGFGDRGFAITDFAGSIDGGWSAAVQADGRIVTAGDTGGNPGTTIDFALTRHTAAGAPDTSFG